jgi:hypothetical protein
VARRPRKSAKEPLEWRSRPDWLLSGGDTTSQPAAKWQLIVFPEIPASAVLHVSLYAYYPDVPLLLAQWRLSDFSSLSESNAATTKASNP